MNYKQIYQDNLTIIDKLRKIDILNELDFSCDENLGEVEITKLMQLASLFSLENEYYEISYEITTKLFKNFYEKYPSLNDFAYSILSRVGNFPNRELLEKYGFNGNSIKNFKLLSEIFTRETDNKIFINNKKFLLTDFQKKFYETLLNKDKFSISAPTSAGKSFIFQRAIIAKFLNNIEQNIVFIVPTRALIIEFSKNMRKLIKEYNVDVEIRTLPILKENDTKKILFILTQERLNTLLSDNENQLEIDVLFVDEAQEIQNNRGVILQNTVEKFLAKFPNASLYFASPLIKNPNLFNKMYNFSISDYSIEDFSPVGQNIIFVSSISGKTFEVKIDLFKNKRYIEITKETLNFKFRGKAQIIDFSIFITKDDEQTIIYSNTPDVAEKNALLLARKLDVTQDDEINNFIEYIKEDIHPNYSLIECLKKGVAYHYSYMPSNVKVKIEDLANRGKLKFICCTSTLLQGVNLPVKNIVVYKPKAGKYNKMKRSDFLNLIGRAGRLQKEFNGNIWCIEIKDWEDEIYKGEKLQEIKPYYEEALLNNTQSIIKVAKEEKLDKEEKKKSFDTVFGKFFVDEVIDKNNIYNLRELKEEVSKIDLILSTEIYKKHYSIHPNGLNRLYNALKQEENLYDFIPKPIFSEGIGDNLRNIIQIINKEMLKIENNSYKFLANMIRQWIHNNLLKDIIINHHNYYENNKISTSIKEVLEAIEKKIRFKYVLYTAAYINILKIVLEEKNLQIENIPNLPLCLESGTGDPIILNLISLGLSRNTSIRLKNLNIVNDCENIKDCYEVLKQINIDNLNLPYILKEEILSIL
jgi:replicative superfamily II helicase